jgi:predicted nucleotidyltransferase component of viral defense system
VSPDVPASIKARLLNLAKASEVEFQLYLVRYACERFLYRLGASKHRERCMLKGAGLLALWMSDPYRMTRDLDFLASGANDEGSIAELVTTVCGVACPEDGLAFDLDSIAISPIRAEAEYPGQRVRLTAYLGTARIRFQLDFGFGDAVTPPPQESEYPTLLPGLPAPHVRAYRREVSVAEKFEAMVTLGRRNSRMKDFHDIWALSSEFEFVGSTLREAVSACFERRGAPWTPETPEPLDAAFYGHAELRARWADYTRAGAFRAPPPTGFEALGGRIRAFLGPVRNSILAGVPFDARWGAGGSWRSTAELET